MARWKVCKPERGELLRLDELSGFGRATVPWSLRNEVNTSFLQGNKLQRPRDPGRGGGPMEREIRGNVLNKFPNGKQCYFPCVSQGTRPTTHRANKYWCQSLLWVPRLLLQRQVLESFPLQLGGHPVCALGAGGSLSGSRARTFPLAGSLFSSLAASCSQPQITFPLTWLF